MLWVMRSSTKKKHRKNFILQILIKSSAKFPFVHVWLRVPERPMCREKAHLPAAAVNGKSVTKHKRPVAGLLCAPRPGSRYLATGMAKTEQHIADALRSYV